MVRRSKEIGAAPASRVASELAPTPDPTRGSANGSPKGIPRGSASPNTNYCQYLGSLVTKLDHVARVPIFIVESAASCVLSSSKTEQTARLKCVSSKYAKATLVLIGLVVISTCVLPMHQTPLAILIKLFPTKSNQLRRFYTKVANQNIISGVPLPLDLLSQLDATPNISVKDFDANKPVDVSSDAVGQYKLINATAHLWSLRKAVDLHETGQSAPIFKALDSLLISLLPHIRRDQLSVALQELVYFDMFYERGAYFPLVHTDGNWLQFPGADGFQVWYMMEENDNDGGNMFMAHTNDLHKDDLPVIYVQSDDGTIMKRINDFDRSLDNDIPVKTFSSFNETGLEFRYLDMHAGDCLIFSKRTLHVSDPRPFLAGLSVKRRALNVRIVLRDKGKDTIPVFPFYQNLFPVHSWLKHKAQKQARDTKQIVKNIVHVPISRFDMLDLFRPPW